MDIGKQQRVIKVEPMAAPEPEATAPEPPHESTTAAPTRPARRHRPAGRPAAHQES